MHHFYSDRKSEFFLADKGSKFIQTYQPKIRTIQRHNESGHFNCGLSFVRFFSLSLCISHRFVAAAANGFSFHASKTHMLMHITTIFDCRTRTLHITFSLSLSNSILLDLFAHFENTRHSFPLPNEKKIRV